MIRMLQEIPLTDDERAAVDGDMAAIERLLERLETTPTPIRHNCGDCKKCVPEGSCVIDCTIIKCMQRRHGNGVAYGDADYTEPS